MLQCVQWLPGSPGRPRQRRHRHRPSPGLGAAGCLCALPWSAVGLPLALQAQRSCEAAELSGGAAPHTRSASPAQKPSHPVAHPPCHAGFTGLAHSCRSRRKRCEHWPRPPAPLGSTFCKPQGRAAPPSSAGPSLVVPRTPPLAARAAGVTPAPNSPRPPPAATRHHSVPAMAASEQAADKPRCRLRSAAPTSTTCCCFLSGTSRRRPSCARRRAWGRRRRAAGALAPIQIGFAACCTLWLRALRAQAFRWPPS